MVGFAKFIDLEYVEISSSAYINMLNNFKINISSMFAFVLYAKSVCVWKSTGLLNFMWARFQTSETQSDYK